MSLSYQDVFAFPSGSLGYVRDYDGGVSLFVDGVLDWRLPTPEPLLQIRAGYLGGVVVIGKGNSSGHAFVSISGNSVADFGPTAGDNTVCVGPDGVYIVRAADRCDVLSTTGVFIRQERMAFGSQGIRDVTPDGDIRTGDAWHSRTVSGLTLFQPSQRGLVWVGQSDVVNQINAIVAGVWSTPLVGPGYEPHVCQLSTDRYAMCARPFTAPVIFPPIPPFISGDASVPPQPALKVPAITVEPNAWIQHNRNGESMRFYDRENEPRTTWRVFIENGGVRVEAENAAGKGQTGAFRPVVAS